VPQIETDGLEVLETREWVDSLDYVLSKGGGPNRAGRLLQQLEHLRDARLNGGSLMRNPTGRLSIGHWRRCAMPVSYTHLTLPTICSV